MTRQNEPTEFYSMAQTGSVADIRIFGDVSSWPCKDGDVSAATLSHQLDQLTGVAQINVHINSYGGEVAEGLAIYNALRRNPAKIVTTCDGMACSIASVIFMAGDERIMSEASVLMIHNAFVFAMGDAAELRKQADDVEKINAASKIAYLSRVAISEEELASMMDAETYILPDEALSMGFATKVAAYETTTAAAQSARRMIIQRLTGGRMLLNDMRKPAPEVRQYLKRGVEPDDGAEQADPPRRDDDPDRDDDREPDRDDTPDRDDPDDTPDTDTPDRDDPDPDEPDDDPDDPDRKPRAKQSLAKFLRMEA